MVIKTKISIRLTISVRNGVPDTPVNVNVAYDSSHSSPIHNVSLHSISSNAGLRTSITYVYRQTRKH